MRLSIMVAQVSAVWDVARNLATVREVLTEARAGDVVVLPEGLLSGYGEDLSPLDDLDPAALTDAIARVETLARRHRVHLFCGTLLPENAGWSNAGLYFPAAGTHRVYRKINLAMNERGPLRPGDVLPTFEVSLAATPEGSPTQQSNAPHGDGPARQSSPAQKSSTTREDSAAGAGGRFTAGIQLCREIRFPEQWQHLAAAGADLLVYLTNAANPNEPTGVWRSHLISRAAENQRFLVSANIPHPDQHCPSMVVSPRGEVLAELPAAQPGLLRHTIDLADNSTWYLGQRRRDVLSLAYHGR